MLTQQAERRVSQVLFAGVALSAVLLTVGAILGAAGADERFDVITDAGLILLMATPPMRVIALGLGFLAGGERRQAAIAAAVLLLLLVSALLGVWVDEDD